MSQPRGRVRITQEILVPGLPPVLKMGNWRSNLALYGCADIAARLLSGDQRYRLSTMYIEFANLDSPGDTTPPPSFDRSGGLDYYLGLVSDDTKDYLRVPIFSYGITSEDETLFPLGNIVQFTAKTAGLVGINGKPFSSDYNSTIIGGAVVATPEPENSAADIVYARWYEEEEAQLLKEANSQLCVTWELTLG